MRDNAPVRTSPVVGKKAWFGPRRFGWGLEPASLEGWIVTAAMVAAMLVRRKVEQRHRWVIQLVVLALLATILLKGTSPGGPHARSEFKAAQGDKAD